MQKCLNPSQLSKMDWQSNHNSTTKFPEKFNIKQIIVFTVYCNQLRVKKSNSKLGPLAQSNF